MIELLLHQQSKEYMNITKNAGTGQALSSLPAHSKVYTVRTQQQELLAQAIMSLNTGSCGICRDCIVVAAGSFIVLTPLATPRGKLTPH